MKKYRKLIKILLIMIAVPVVMLLLLVAFLMYALTGDFEEKILPPEIESGEFPFRLVYEIDGQSCTVEDAVVCRYEGIQNYGGIETRKWETTLKSGNEQVVLLDLSDKNDKTADGQLILRLIFNVGNANYYMGDTARRQIAPQSLERVRFVRVDSFNHEQIDSMSVDEAYEKYGIRFISWECASPIESCRQP